MTDNTDKDSPEIPGYEVSHRLGSGGMADVYLGTQLSLSRPVAIKVLAAERTHGVEVVTRFEHEARTIARLSHPHIVSIFDVGRTADGRLYYVMPYLPNGDLSAHDLHGDEQVILETLRALCRALGYAHNLGIVHRDVKPENVLFDKSDRPLLADFGIALTTHEMERVTREGSTMGSSGYMSPEQARGFALDGRADLYSLGVVAYELLSGELPFKGPDTLAVALAHVEQPIPRLPPSRRRWQSFIDKAMAKSPPERFQGAAQMEMALDDIAAKLAGAPAPGYATKPMTSLPVRGRRGGLRAYSGLIAASILIVIGISMLSVALMNFFAPAQNSSVAVAVPAVAAPSADGSMRAAETKIEPVPKPGIPEAISTTTSTPPAQGKDATETNAQTGDAAAASAPPDAPASDAMTEKDKSAKPSRLRLADLTAGAVLRDHGGPTLAYVPPQPPHGGNADDIDHGFALSRNEITRSEYAAFARATSREAVKCRVPMSPFSLLKKLSWREPGFAQDDTHPVVCVSWDDANAYVQWLSQRLHARYRLPTHAEWVHATRWNPSGVNACAQGNLADDKRSVFHRSDANACSDGYAFTAPVGQFKPNLLGIHDLIGNVSEWTLDCKPGGHDAKKDDSAACRERMFSGNSWRDAAGDHSLDFEDNADATVGYTTIGFRVLRELDPDNLAALVK